MIDVGILVVFLYFVLGGFTRGFIKQTSTILGLVLALIISISYYRALQPYFDSYLDLSAGMLQFVSFTVLFILVNIVVQLLAMVLKNVMDLVFLEPVDRVAGAVLGLFKGGILAYLIVLLLSQLPSVRLTAVLKNSYLATSLLNMTPLIQENLEEFFRP